jgi:hypothetical protein
MDFCTPWAMPGSAVIVNVQVGSVKTSQVLTVPGGESFGGRNVIREDARAGRLGVSISGCRAIAR